MAHRDDIDTSAPETARQLLPLVYQELRRVAASKIAHEKPGQTLQPTALVHEAWIRLQGSSQKWRDKRHFFAAAAEAMRRILVDKARKKARVRHGGGLKREPFDDLEIPLVGQDEKCLAIHECLDRLELEEPDAATVVKLKMFVGLKAAEMADALDVSEKTVLRRWKFAVAWLSREMSTYDE